MPLITEMFAFVVSDSAPDDEGVIALAGLPLVGADLARVASLTEAAQRIADATGKQVRIYKFGAKEQIGEINPRPKS